MKTKLRSGLTILALVCSVYAIGQPCLNTWKYRVPITVDNTANPTALNNHQMKFVINTQDLVVAGKAKADGGDIRVLDKNGNHLPFWIQDNTYNTPSTIIWANVGTVAANGVDSIYLFYGRSSAASLSSGIDALWGPLHGGANH
mgnify:FL=1